MKDTLEKLKDELKTVQKERDDNREKIKMYESEKKTFKNVEDKLQSEKEKIEEENKDLKSLIVKYKEDYKNAAEAIKVLEDENKNKTNDEDFKALETEHTRMKTMAINHIKKLKTDVKIIIVILMCKSIKCFVPSQSLIPSRENISTTKIMI